MSERSEREPVHPETPKPTIRLEFFRHDERSKEPQQGVPHDDNNMRITPAGREHAQGEGATKDPHPDVAVLFGSERDRSLETAFHQAYANDPDITPSMTLEEMKEATSMPYGQKHHQIPELNFNIDGSAEYKKAVEQAYFKDNKYLEFLYEHSDEVAEKAGDKVSSTYSRQAANIAKLIRKYVDIVPRWEELTTQEPQKYAGFNNEMQRFMGTHGGIQECFLMKVIDKLEGREAALAFARSLAGGFGYSEGFSVALEKGDDDLRVVVNYKDKSWEITPEILDEIIQENPI